MMYGQFLLSFVPKYPPASSVDIKYSCSPPLAFDSTWLCDFMDIKIPKHTNKSLSPRMKKRPLGSWKVWQRHWCTIRKVGPGLGLEILLDCGVGRDGLVFPKDKENKIHIPPNAIICRTESKTKKYAFGVFPANDRKPIIYFSANSETQTQRWMAKIRQQLRPRLHRFIDGHYNVSMVDNSHSRSAGLTGLYGDLVSSASGIFIKDVNNGDIVETFDWKELDQMHLATRGQPEDVKKIVVIHTNKEFRGGMGELHLFCSDASRLLNDLVTKGRGPKNEHLHPRPLRPLSLSEGDLRLSIIQNDDNCKGSPILKHKVNSGLIFSKNLTSKSNSQSRAIDNEYHAEPFSGIPDATSSLEELEESFDLRRISYISNASGIYEEIKEPTSPTKMIRVSSNLYENTEDLLLNYSVTLMPPPLPPRQRFGSSSTTRTTSSISDDGLDSEGDTRSATPNTQEDATPTPEEKSIGGRILIDSSEYVIMSPIARERMTHLGMEEDKGFVDEDVYLIMR